MSLIYRFQCTACLRGFATPHMPRLIASCHSVFCTSCFLTDIRCSYPAMWHQLISRLQQGDVRALARAISLVENEYDGYFGMLQNLPSSSIPVTGITGPPGAGKSTLTDAIIAQLVGAGKRVAVICIDPSSPFNLGALLGDRIRMSTWYNNPNVFIRSLATRGSLGGLHPHILEITDLIKAAPFDHILIETVGVGQSEIEIAGLADTTVVVLVPEAGDEIQTMKAGLMEVADIFVVNKADREGADTFVKNLRLMLAPVYHSAGANIPVVKTVADKQSGVAELVMAINSHLSVQQTSERKYHLLAQRAWLLIQKQQMKRFSRDELYTHIRQSAETGPFNLYTLVRDFVKT